MIERIFPGFDETRVVAARSLAASGEEEKALRVYTEIGELQSELHYQDASILLKQGQIEIAIDVLKKCLEANPSHEGAILKFAEMASGDEAIDACDMAINLAPSNVRNYIRLSKILAEKKNKEDAKKILNKALNHDSENFDVHLELAEIYASDCEYRLAEIHLKKCLIKTPTSLNAIEKLLEIYDRLDRLSDAEKLCRTFLESTSSSPLISARLAHFLFRQGRLQEAEQLFNVLLTEFPNWTQLRNIYSQALVKNGRAKDAESLGIKNLEIAPTNAESYINLADLQFALNNREGFRSTLLHLSKMYDNSTDWGLNGLQHNLATRLIFSELPNISKLYCDGQTSLVDTTNVNVNEDYISGEIIELFCMVVGTEHVNYLETISYPAISNSPGFASLINSRRVVYNIYTTPEDFKKLKNFLRKLDGDGIRYRVNVELLSMSQNLYNILCLPIIDQVKRSLSLGSIVVCALPDIIISGPISKIIDKMDPGQTVVCAGPRINSIVAAPALRSIIETEKRLYSPDFVKKCITDYLHPQTIHAFKNDSNRLLYRDYGGYISARNWAPPPIIFGARPEMLDHMIHNPICGPTSIASFYAIDHDFVVSAHLNKCLYLIPDSNDFFWAELTHPKRHVDFLSGSRNEAYYYPEASKHIYGHEFKWIYEN